MLTLLAWCNGAKAGNPAWRISVPPQDSDEAATYTSYDTLAAGKRDSWSIFLKFNRDFTKAKVRSWITDVWGNATAGSDAAAILNGAGLRNITRAEAVLGGSNISNYATGNASGAAPLPAGAAGVTVVTDGLTGRSAGWPHTTMPISPPMLVPTQSRVAGFRCANRPNMSPA